jgi:hypothetical protein
LSGQKYIVSSQFKVVWDYLETHIETSEKDKSLAFLSKSIKASKSKFKEYDCFDDIFTICHLIDPRFKTSLFESKSKSKAAVRTLQTLFKEYQTHAKDNPREGNSGQLESSQSKKPKPLIERIKERFTHSEELNEDEIIRYLNASTLQMDDNILDWWSKNQKGYPILSKIARDYLAVMPTSTASERAFSAAGRTISKIRNRLDPEMANELLSLASWKHISNKN